MNLLLDSRVLGLVHRIRTSGSALSAPDPFYDCREATIYLRGLHSRQSTPRTDSAGHQRRLGGLLCKWSPSQDCAILLNIRSSLRQYTTV